jgi:hypothetical protein
MCELNGLEGMSPPYNVTLSTAKGFIAESHRRFAV